MRARVRALYFSNTPAARHAVIACALYFVFFFFLLRCLVLRTAFACHLARRGPTPRLPACCVRLLRARAAAAALFCLLLPLLVLPLPLAGCRCRCCRCQILRAAHSSSFSSSASSARTGFGRREIFYQKVQLPTHAKNLVGTSPPASALSLSALAPTRACARCMRAAIYFFHFHFPGEARTTRAARAHAHSRALAVSVSVRQPPTATFV